MANYNRPDDSSCVSIKSHPDGIEWERIKMGIGEGAWPLNVAVDNIFYNGHPLNIYQLTPSGTITPPTRRTTSRHIVKQKDEWNGLLLLLHYTTPPAVALYSNKLLCGGVGGWLMVEHSNGRWLVGRSVGAEFCNEATTTTMTITSSINKFPSHISYTWLHNLFVSHSLYESLICDIIICNF